ncbi:P-loop containing nucleoside triphosphate hydrolase protein [Rhizoclosmatium globosum]|uniref:p-loop containing nucleoside triphosphate hydrolase protein n=1 Tax=Rhizoclosmatium globosum TaxID=329046 RepID=A0A1Y2BZH4_9FUNG|nr:P-loop containing nucleoside triphosphate hydrolase protein [Rhizoclosmatium globosum]|eukprot:ORY40168.1 P-loop containing nucleoside triphosphate hydrolase protein [Rhizoclosmatium globosum]
MTVEPASSAISVPQRIKWNPLTFATVAWIYPVLRTGYKKPLEESDLPLLGENESAINLQKWLDAVVDAFCQLTAVAMTTLQSLMIGEILKYVNPLFPREDLFWNNGVGLAFLMLGMQLLYTFAETISQSIGMVLQLRIKGAVVNAVYKKSLNLSSKSRRAFPAGKVNSLASSDVQMIMAFVESVNKVWSMPVQLCLSLYFVSRLMGVATATAGGIFVGLAGLSAALSGPLGNAFKEYMKTLDKERLQCTRENSSCACQANHCTIPYRFRIYLLIGVIVLQNTLTSPLTFITYGALGHEMSPQIIFPSLSFLSSLMAISGMLPQIVFAVLQSTVSYKRLSNFLLAEEAVPEDKPSSEAVAADNASSIILDNASFTWEQVSEVKDEEELKAEQAKEKKLNKKNKGKVTPPLAEKVNSPAVVETDSDVFALENFSFSVKKGSLVAVVGATGSGKSSLLAGLAGSMRKTSGNATIFGSVAYCPQEPWIISGTIQENITLLDANLADAAQTAIEAYTNWREGINLSGGQKARIALARAITKNPDVYILDDPLSALDSHVNVVIATHLLHILPQVDQVIVLDGGKIVQNGTYNDLIADTNGKLFETMKDYHLDDEETASKSTKKATVAAKETDKEETAEAEDRETGAVSFATYKSYAKPLVSIGFSSRQRCLYSSVVLMLQSNWHSPLGRQTTGTEQSKHIILYIYLGLSIFVSLVMDVRSLDNGTGMIITNLFDSVYIVVATLIITFAILGVTGVMPSALVGVALTQISYFAPSFKEFCSLLRTSKPTLPQEAPRILPKDATLSNWPTAGSIEIRDLKLAYESRPDHLVVNGISSRFKLVKKLVLSVAQSGTISIDGENISSLGLKKLRTSIQMIPQNPVLFDGTVRSNIDVLTKYSDDDLWYALECVGMKEYVSGLSGKLDSPITEGGTTCLLVSVNCVPAKVLLEKSKILIMDEATSSVDAESDKRIQDSMKTYFKDATVLSVAHRLNTIAAFDKVLVLENGKVAEFEPPHLLLSREGTIFGEMVNATGVANAAVIRDIAKDHYYSSK